MPAPEDLVLIALVFLLAGTVKGVIGLGLPSVSLGLLTTFMGLPGAIALMLAPSLVTNAWQALAGPHLRDVWRETGVFMLVATVSIVPMAALAGRADVALLTVLLGAALAAYAVVGMLRPGWHLAERKRRWVGPLAGASNGALTGLTGSFVVPGVAYLQALGLERSALVQAMGVLFTLSTAALGLTLAVVQGSGTMTGLTGPLAIVSALAVVPALIGMQIGQWLRNRLSEQQFRWVFFRALLALGAWIVVSHLSELT